MQKLWGEMMIFSLNGGFHRVYICALTAFDLYLSLTPLSIVSHCRSTAGDNWPLHIRLDNIRPCPLDRTDYRQWRVRGGVS